MKIEIDLNDREALADIELRYRNEVAERGGAYVDCLRRALMPVRDVRGMAEVIRLNCADLDAAEAVLRTYIEREWEGAYDRGREDHRAHDCCGGGAG